MPLFTALACSSGSPKVTESNSNPWPTGVTLPQPPADIPEPVRGKALALEQDVATALCNRAGPCCTSLGTSLGNNCVTYASLVWAVALTAKFSSSPDANVEYAFDESHAATCRDQLAQLESGCGFELVRSSPYNMNAMTQLQAICSASITVTVSGEPWQCVSDNDCIAYGDGLICANSKCVDPATCQAQASDAGSSDCVAELALNDACSTSSSPICARGLTCKGNICVPLPAEGEACTGASDCEDGLYCLPSSPSDPFGAGICRALGPRGQVPCTDGWQCKYECVSGTCDPRADAFCVTPH